MDKEEILGKHSGFEGICVTKGMVRGSDALEAMQEYAEQESRKDNLKLLCERDLYRDKYKWAIQQEIGLRSVITHQDSQYEKIAIGFAKWKDENCARIIQPQSLGINGGKKLFNIHKGYTGKCFTVEQLYEIYKVNVFDKQYNTKIIETKTKEND